MNREDGMRYTALLLSAVIVAVYGMEWGAPWLVDVFGFQAEAFLRKPWTIVTSLLLHDAYDYMHLLNNLFFLTVFGFILENQIGTRRFLTLFVAGGIFANLSAFIFYPGSTVIGASGAISAIVAALAVSRPRQVGLLWGVPVPMWAVLIGWVGFNLLGVGASGGIAFEAHLFGLAFGAGYGVLVLDREHRDGRDEVERGEVDVDVEAWEEEYMLPDREEQGRSQQRRGRN